MNSDNYIVRISKAILAKVDSAELPREGIDDLFNSYAVLALTKGSAVSNRDVHDAWAAWATEHNSDSDAIVPYEDLSQDVQNEDTRFTEAIKSVVADIEDGLISK